METEDNITVVSCVWCGHAFPSNKISQAQHLYDHAKECSKHPVSKLVTLLCQALPYVEDANDNAKLVREINEAIK